MNTKPILPAPKVKVKKKAVALAEQEVSKLTGPVGESVKPYAEADTIEGTRQSLDRRYDLLDPSFIEKLAELAHEGFLRYDVPRNPDAKFGDLDWQHGLSGDKVPINHAMDHITRYCAGKDNDGKPANTHLINAAFNLMMEWYFSNQ